MHIAKNARAPAALSTAATRACARTRKEDKSGKKERERERECRQWLKCINPPAPPNPPDAAHHLVPAASPRIFLTAAGILHASRKIIVRRNFRARRAGILRAFAYDGNCSRRMMYGSVARRVRSSHYGRLNEQFLSTFILSGTARGFPRENTPASTCSPYLELR